MKDRALIRTGIAGTTIAMLCCVTPVLAVLLGAVGLAAWLAWADYVLFPALVMFMAITAVGFLHLRRRMAAVTYCDTGTAEPEGMQR